MIGGISEHQESFITQLVAAQSTDISQTLELQTLIPAQDDAVNLFYPIDQSGRAGLQNFG